MAGLEIENDSGVIQIGNGYRVPSLRARGTIAGGAGTFSWSGVGNAIPAIRVNGPHASAGIFGLSQSGSTFTCEAVTVGGPPSSIDWYVFGDPLPVSGPSMGRSGLEFADDFGNMLFSTDNGPMLMVNHQPYRSTPLPAGKKFAFFGGMISHYDLSIDIELDSFNNITYIHRWRRDYEGWSVKEGQVITKPFTLVGSGGGQGTGGGNNGPENRAPSAFYLIDVTGLP